MEENKRLLAPVGHMSAVPVLCLRKYAGVWLQNGKEEKKCQCRLPASGACPNFLVVPHRRIKACGFLRAWPFVPIPISWTGELFLRQEEEIRTRASVVMNAQRPSTVKYEGNVGHSSWGLRIGASTRAVVLVIV